MHKLSGQGVRIAFRKGLLYEVLSLNAVATSCMALIDLSWMLACHSLDPSFLAPMR